MERKSKKIIAFLVATIMIAAMFPSVILYAAEGRGKASYYSKMESPYAEIKSNSPEDERYEATTAIPKEEPLYVGFGATEFMLNMEVEEKESSGSRNYILTYTCEKCIEKDAKCTISKTTHTHYCKDGADRKGKPVMKAHTYTCGNACPKCGDRSACLGDRHKCAHKAGAVGIGCQASVKINREHPHSHTFKGKITQAIAPFRYIDIKGLELWQVNRLILEGNKKLFVNPHHIVKPFTGYRAFYTQEGYRNHNGRLVFSFQFQDAQKYGDTKTTEVNASKMRKEDCDKLATTWMNKQVAGKRVKAKVISDYVSLTTTEGYQVPMYYEYESDITEITSERFVTGSESKEIVGNPILFQKMPSWEEMWTENSNAAAKWEPTHITRSGYNGNYFDPAHKYDNDNIVMASDPAAYLGNHPYGKNKKGESDFNQNILNQRMIRKEITTIEEVANGFWNTGRCFLEADKEIAYRMTGGTDYGKNSDRYRTEVYYAMGYNKVNDIIRIQSWN